MSKRVAIYARVSTDGQTTENQLQELRKVAEHMKWFVCHEFIDQGISGAKGRNNRPEFDKLLKSAVQRKFDVIMVWSVDRLGRSLQDLVSFLSDVHTTGIDLFIHQQGIDTTTPSGKAMFQMIGVFAEFERSMIRERVIAGQTRAMSQGKKIGRPKVDPAKEEAIRLLRQQGKGIRKIAKELHIGVSVVQRVIG